MYWFCSDSHFGHNNILEYCNRPFSTIQEMDKTLIENWNKRVKKTDTVFFLGDFCFKRCTEAPDGSPFEHYRNQLNGEIVFVKGNHDRGNNGFKPILLGGVIEYGGEKIYLVHKPEHANLNYKINFVGHVHCFDDQTEVLTSVGWKTINNISYQDTVISLNQKTGLLEETIINTVIKKSFDGDLVKYKGSMDFAFTENHRMLFKKEKTHFYQSENINYLEQYRNTNFTVFTSGESNQPGLPLTDDEIKLCVWICADSHISYNRKSYFIRFKLSKERKILELENLLKRLNIKYSKNKCKKESYQTLTPYRFNILSELPDNIKHYFIIAKILPNDFRRLSKSQVQVLFDTYAITDGHKYDSSYQISTSKKQECDLLQELAILNGYSSCFCKKTFVHKNTNYVLSIIPNRKEIILNTKNLYRENYKGRIWCLNVPLDTLITRRNGHVIISHNSAWKIKKVENTLLVNMSVDVWNFEPVNIHQILKAIAKWKRENPQ